MLVALGVPACRESQPPVPSAPAASRPADPAAAAALLVTAREQPVDPAFARTLGIDCKTMRYIGLKSAAHFRSGFERIAGSIHNVDAAALHTHDFSQLNFKNRTRPMYPVEIPSDPG